HGRPAHARGGDDPDGRHTPGAGAPGPRRPPRARRRGLRWSAGRPTARPACAARRRAGLSASGARHADGPDEPTAVRPGTAARDARRRRARLRARSGRGLAAPLPAARLLGTGACGAEVVHVVRVLDETVVDVVTHLPARRADEVDALDGLVDALAVQDPPLQLLDADAEQLLVLALDLAPARLILRQVLLTVVGVQLLVVEDAEAFVLATATATATAGCLFALARAWHASGLLRQRVRSL